MDEFFRNAPKIIEEAAKSPLGIAALIVLAFTFLAFFYFRKASEATRLVIFGVMGAGALMLLAILVAAHAVQRTDRPWEPSPRPDVPSGTTLTPHVLPRRTAQPPPPPQSPRFCVTPYGQCPLPPGWTPGERCGCVISNERQRYSPGWPE